jgi:hypothetical protein
MIKLILPYPDKSLNPNVAKHYYFKAKIKKHARQVGYNLSVNHKDYFADNVRLSVDIIIHKGDRRKFDIDNVLAAAKNILDGVADGIGYDDNQLDKIVLRRGAVDKENPRVELIIKEIKD